MKNRNYFLLLIMFLAATNAAVGQAPKTLGYQGYLSDGGGPLTGSHNLTFAIYDAASGGNNLWTETSTGVVVTNGNVSLTLGKLNPVNIQTITPLWLGITVDSNPEIFPRVEMSGSLYSLGLALPYEGTSTDNVPAIKIVKTGTSNAAAFQIDNPGNGSSAVSGTTNGSGTAGLFVTTGSGAAVAGITSGIGAAGEFVNYSTENAAHTLKAQTFGTGSAGSLSISNPSSTASVLNITHSGTGNAITANRPIQATQFIGDGSLLTNLPSSGLTLPFAATSTDNVIAFDLVKTGLAPAAKFATTNPSNFNPTLHATTVAGVYAGQFESNGAFWGGAILGLNNGLGTGGEFRIDNGSNSEPALRVETNGTGPAGRFTNTKVSSTSPALEVEGRGMGFAMRVSKGNVTGSAMHVFMPIGSSEAAIYISQNGSGAAIYATAPIAATQFVGQTSSTFGNAGSFSSSHISSPSAVLLAQGAGSGPSVRAEASGTGRGLQVSILNAASTADAINISHAGTGNAITANRPIQATQFIGDGSLLTGISGSGFSLPYSATISASSAALEIVNTGSSYAAQFAINNPASGAHAVYATSNGSGNAASFYSSGPAGGGALSALQGGMGFNAEFNTANSSNIYPVIRASTNGTGKGIQVDMLNSGSTAAAINISHSGTGNAITANRPIQATQFIGDGSLLTGVTGLTLPFSQATGAGTVAFQIENTAATGVAGFFRNSNINNTGSTLLVSNSAQNGWGLQAYSEGGPAAIVELANPSGSHVALMASNDGLGAVATLTQYNTSNSAPALQIQHVGTGNAITANRPIQATQFIAQGNGIPAIQISSGGLRYNVTEVTSSSIATRSTVYNIASGGSSYTITFSSTEGDTFYAFNSTGSSITIEGVTLGAGELGQLLYVAGAWRGL